MEDGVVTGVTEGAEQAGLVVARIFEQRERLICVGRDDDLVEAAPLPIVGRQLDPVRVAPERAGAEPELEARTEPIREGADVGVGSAADRSPGEAAEARASRDCRRSGWRRRPETRARGRARSTRAPR